MSQWHSFVFHRNFHDPYHVGFTYCEPPIREQLGRRLTFPEESPSVPDFVVLDPNNPLFKAIEKISCYFHPFTNPALSDNLTMDKAYEEYNKPFSDLSEHLKMLHNISNTVQVYKLKTSTLKKSSLAKFTLHPNVNEVRIDGDFNYYKVLVKRHSDTVRKIFSKLELYDEMFRVMNILTHFTLAGLTRDDFRKVDLFQLGEELKTESTGAERCNDGKKSP